MVNSRFHERLSWHCIPSNTPHRRANARFFWENSLNSSDLEVSPILDQLCTRPAHSHCVPGSALVQEVGPRAPQANQFSLPIPPDWAPHRGHPGSAHTASAPESSGHPSALQRQRVCLPVPTLGGPGTRQRQQLQARSGPDGKGNSGQWLQPCHQSGMDPPACTGHHGAPPPAPPGAQGVTLFGNRFSPGEIKLRLAHPG